MFKRVIFRRTPGLLPSRTNPSKLLTRFENCWLVLEISNAAANAVNTMRHKRSETTELTAQSSEVFD